MNAPVRPDSVLGAIVGNSPMPRTEIVKKIWDYIKANNLQDANDKRTIIADSKLRPLFGTDKLNMMKLAGCISAHISK